MTRKILYVRAEALFFTIFPCLTWILPPCDWKPLYDFLLIAISNLSRISYRFRDIATKRLEICTFAAFYHPSLAVVFKAVTKGSSVNYCKNLASKQNSLGCYRQRKPHNPACISCDVWRMDSQTDRRIWYSRVALCITVLCWCATKVSAR